MKVSLVFLLLPSVSPVKYAVSLQDQIRWHSVMITYSHRELNHQYLQNPCNQNINN